MNTVLKAREPSGQYLVAAEPALLRSFDLLATAPGATAKLRGLILSLAVQGRLVQQEPTDAPAGVLLAVIRAERSSEGTAVDQASPADAIPFDVPSNWEWASLGEVVDLIRGITFPASEKTKVPAPNRIACLRTTNVQHSIEWHDLLFVDRSFMGREAQLIRHHDVVMSMANSRELVGKVALIDHVPHAEATFGGFLGVLRPRHIDPRYVMAVLRTDYARRALVGSASQTTNIANISLGKLRPLPFPLPPLAEQHRIVARVEELMKLCDALEQSGRLADEQHARLTSTLFEALAASESTHALAENWQRVAEHFDLLLDRPEPIDDLEQTILQLAVRGLLVAQEPADESGLKLATHIQWSRTARRKIMPKSDEESFAPSGLLPASWAWASIDQVSADDDRAITDGPFGANLKTEHYIDRPGFRVVRLQNIGHGEFRDEHRAYIDESRFDELVKHQVFSGDLVVAGLIDTSIRSCAIPADIGPAIVKADCYRLSVHPLVSARYVLHYLNSAMAHEFAAIHHHGLTLTRIGLGNFRGIPIPLPPVAEQHRIVSRVEELLRLCAQLRERLTEARRTQSQLADALVASETDDGAN